MDGTSHIGRAVALSCGILALVAALVVICALAGGGAYVLLGR